MTAAPVPSATKKKLIALADRYETAAFLEKDPAQFMHRYSSPRDMEVMAFIASSLAFGNRKQILLHTERICDDIEKRSAGSPADWISDGAYKKFFRESDESFYRMMSHGTMRIFCATMQSLLETHGTFGGAAKSAWQKNPDGFLHHSIASLFPADCAIVCHGKTSCAKRLQMFLRWMVRDGSPVDLGLWSGWYPKAKLLMPLDTHVMQEAARLSLIVPAKSGKLPSPSLRLALGLTESMAQVFPGDPVRADFALFALGVDG